MLYEGHRVLVSQHLPQAPAIELSRACPCSDEVRAEMNAYLRSLFGTREQMFYVAGVGLVVSPATYEKLKGACHVR